MSSSDDRTPRERLESNLKSPYPADGPVWSALIAAVAKEIAELETARQSVLAAKFVSSAEAEQLDRLASIFELERRTGEPDARFRIRLQTALRAQLSSATVSDLRETVGVLLGGSASDVVVEEPEADQPVVDEIAVAPRAGVGVGEKAVALLENPVVFPDALLERPGVVDVVVTARRDDAGVDVDAHHPRLGAGSNIIPPPPTRPAAFTAATRVVLHG